MRNTRHSGVRALQRTLRKSCRAIFFVGEAAAPFLWHQGCSSLRGAQGRLQSQYLSQNAQPCKFRFAINQPLCVWTFFRTVVLHMQESQSHGLQGRQLQLPVLQGRLCNSASWRGRRCSSARNQLQPKAASPIARHRAVVTPSLRRIKRQLSASRIVRPTRKSRLIYTERHKVFTEAGFTPHASCVSVPSQYGLLATTIFLDVWCPNCQIGGTGTHTESQ